MKIFVDENIPKITVNELKSQGFDVLDIRNTIKEGVPDEKVWEIAQNEKRLLITTDKGFSKYRIQNHYGILIVRLQKPNRLKIHNKIMQTINTMNANDWENLIVILKDNVKTSWKKSDKPE
jgi:predicted nuclease of predicted toxin-antitoxin system